VAWNGIPIGTIVIPNISLAGDTRVKQNLSSTFKATNVMHLTNFTKVLLRQQSFNWTISVPDLGIMVGNTSFYKTVTLKGTSKLQNGVIIDSFNLPENIPAGGVHLMLNMTAMSPLQVGIVLSSIGFHN
ncbi:hypothetical protein BS47DRAFT_1303195, partial [Hydnum rufescens UP504]